MDGMLILVSGKTLAHGVIDPLQEGLKSRLEGVDVRYASLEDPRSMADAAEACKGASCDAVAVQPLDGAVDEKALRGVLMGKNLETASIEILRPLIEDVQTIDLIECGFRSVFTSANEYRDIPVEDIQKKSFSIIDSGLSLFRDEPLKRKIVIRAIHAVADFSIAAQFYFSDDAIERGKQALGSGKPIITDVNMIAAGIGTLYRNRALCRVADPEAKDMAESMGITRSAAAFELLKEHFDGAIAVIGNAPTALVHLLRMVEKDGVDPALIIGVPVGFVGAAESKGMLVASRRPCIALRGNRGGSTIAAAIVNALGTLRESP
jgi:precorrin-8X/cobalt-precorrin-8 methylmutase